MALVGGGDTGTLSDGYHTFDELYEHRHHLFMALAIMGPCAAWRSWKHSDGTASYAGWFIAGIDTPHGQITYHLPAQCWSVLDDKVTTYSTAPAWDGHTSADVIGRLQHWIQEGPHVRWP